MTSPVQRAFFLTVIACSFSILSACISLASCPNCSKHASPVFEKLDQGQKHALTVFPLQEGRYTFDVFAQKMKPIVAASLWPDFEKGWRAVMTADESVLHLSIADEIRHIQCLYGKLWPQESRKVYGWIQKQQADIYTALNHPTHMALIKAADANLAAKIDLFFQDL